MTRIEFPEPGTLLRSEKLIKGPSVRFRPTLRVWRNMAGAACGRHLSNIGDNQSPVQEVHFTNVSHLLAEYMSNYNIWEMFESYTTSLHVPGMGERPRSRQANIPNYNTQYKEKTKINTWTRPKPQSRLLHIPAFGSWCTSARQRDEEMHRKQAIVSRVFDR